MNDYELMRLSERMEEDAADLRNYELAELTAEQREDILHRNAEKLLGL